MNIYKVVEIILCRLKTGCQWSKLSVKQFYRAKIPWQSVYYSYRKWCKDERWDYIWQYILNKYKHLLGMFSIQLDVIHTLAKRGGQRVAYQRKEKTKGSNILISSDSRVIDLASNDPEDGNHNSAFCLIPIIKKMGSIQSCGIVIKGLFLKTNVGFGVEDFRKLYCHIKLLATLTNIAGMEPGKNIFLVNFYINTGLWSNV